MSITRRFTQLMKADVHGVLDLLEEPKSIIRQSIREMQEAIEVLEQEQATNRLQQEENERSQEISRSLLSELEQQVTLCLAEGNDELARRVIRRKLETERRLNVLIEQQTSTRQQEEKIAQKLLRYRDQLQQIQDRYELAQATRQCATSDTAGVSDAEVEVALLKEKAKRGTGKQTVDHRGESL